MKCDQRHCNPYTVFYQGCRLFLKTWKCSCKKKFVLEFWNCRYVLEMFLNSEIIKIMIIFKISYVLKLWNIIKYDLEFLYILQINVWCPNIFDVLVITEKFKKKNFTPPPQLRFFFGFPPFFWHSHHRRLMKLGIYVFLMPPSLWRFGFY